MINGRQQITGKRFLIDMGSFIHTIKWNIFIYLEMNVANSFKWWHCMLFFNCDFLIASEMKIDAVHLCQLYIKNKNWRCSTLSHTFLYLVGRSQDLICFRRGGRVGVVKTQCPRTMGKKNYCFMEEKFKNEKVG